MKTFRDPVHGNIKVEHPFILELIDSPLFQRLRHIRQLGLCCLAFPGAEHSRFQHALGAYHLANVVLNGWRQNLAFELPNADRLTVLAAALLHDVGHGPYSHALEHVFSGLSHESIGQQLIRQYLGPIFERHGLQVEECCHLLLPSKAFSPASQLQPPSGANSLNASTSPSILMRDLISGPVDVDRMDYLQRDSLYTGVKYGLFDSERILDCLSPLETPQGLILVLQPKGVEAVEEFLFSRYFMYWQVYFHPTVRAAEAVLRLALQRARWLWTTGRNLELPAPIEFLFRAVNIETGQLNFEFDAEANHREGHLQAEFLAAFLQLEDGDLQSALKLWVASSDFVLRELSTRLRQRRLFKPLPHPGPDSPKLSEVRKFLAQKMGAEVSPYFLGEDLAVGLSKSGGQRPRVVTGAHSWTDLVNVTRSDAILALEKSQRAHGHLFVPCEYRCEVAEILAVPRA